MGWLATAAFVATGVHMEVTFPEAYDGDGVRRMLYRSAHLYIVLSGMAHLLLGAYWQPRATGWPSRLQMWGSCLLLLGPPAFTIAFFVEPGFAELSRPFVFAGLTTSLAGTALHLGSRIAERYPDRAAGDG
jgi:hypothetical protein